MQRVRIVDIIILSRTFRLQIMCNAVCLWQKNTAVHSEQSSNESILIESALEAFSFLDNEDCIGDER